MDREGVTNTGLDKSPKKILFASAKALFHRERKAVVVLEISLDFRLRESSSIEKWIDNPVLDAGKPDSFPRAPPNASDVHIFGGQHLDLSTIYIASIPSAGFHRDWRIGRPEAAELLGWTAVTLWDTRFLDASLGKNIVGAFLVELYFPTHELAAQKQQSCLAERLWLCGALGSLMLLWAKIIVGAFLVELYFPTHELAA